MGRTIKKLNFVYPVRTEGSEHAAELRQRCNKLTDEERKRLLAEGMKRINAGKKGGKGK
jgi:hypothetical protein